MQPKALEKSARRVRACSTYPSRSNPAPGNGKSARESARQIPACSRLSQEPKPIGDLARQIQPLRSRSGRCLDYESSGSPRPSRSYRRSETESLQSDRVHCPSGSDPVTGTAHRQEDRGVRLQNRGDSVTARGQLHTHPRNSAWKFPANSVGKLLQGPVVPGAVPVQTSVSPRFALSSTSYLCKPPTVMPKSTWK